MVVRILRRAKLPTDFARRCVPSSPARRAPIIAWGLNARYDRPIGGSSGEIVRVFPFQRRRGIARD